MGGANGRPAAPPQAGESAHTKLFGWHHPPGWSYVCKRPATCGPFAWCAALSDLPHRRSNVRVTALRGTRRRLICLSLQTT